MFKALNIQNLEQAGEFPRFHADLTTQYSGGSPYPASLEPEIRLMVMEKENSATLVRGRIYRFPDAFDQDRNRLPEQQPKIRLTA